MNPVCIVVLTGLPASGKTSLAKKLNSFLSDKNCVVQLVVFDDLVSLEEQASIALSTETASVFPQKRQLIIAHTLRPTKKTVKKNYEFIELR